MTSIIASMEDITGVLNRIITACTLKRIIAACVVLALLIVSAPGLYEYLLQTTALFGWRNSAVITVQIPTVHTRERLMNDRLDQVAWLDEQLAATRRLPPPQFDVPSSTGNANDGKKSNESKFAADNALANSKAVTPQDITDSDTAAKKVQELSGSASGQTEAYYRKLARPIDMFRSMNGYRDVIRAERAIAMLDDRHDMDGNELYLLSFETTVVAGPASNGYALVEATLSPDSNGLQSGNDINDTPGGLDAGLRIRDLQRADLVDIYFDWLERSQKDLSDRVKENQDYYQHRGVFNSPGLYDSPMTSVKNLLCVEWSSKRIQQDPSQMFESEEFESEEKETQLLRQVCGKLLRKVTMRGEEIAEKERERNLILLFASSGLVNRSLVSDSIDKKSKTYQTSHDALLGRFANMIASIKDITDRINVAEKYLRGRLNQIYRDEYSAKATVNGVMVAPTYEQALSYCTEIRNQLSIENQSASNSANANGKSSLPKYRVVAVSPFAELEELQFAAPDEPTNDAGPRFTACPVPPNDRDVLIALLGLAQSFMGTNVIVDTVSQREQQPCDDRTSLCYLGDNINFSISNQLKNGKNVHVNAEPSLNPIVETVTVRPPEIPTGPVYETYIVPDALKCLAAIAEYDRLNSDAGQIMYGRGERMDNYFTLRIDPHDDGSCALLLEPKIIARHWKKFPPKKDENLGKSEEKAKPTQDEDLVAELDEQDKPSPDEQQILYHLQKRLETLASGTESGEPSPDPTEVELFTYSLSPRLERAYETQREDYENVSGSGLGAVLGLDSRGSFAGQMSDPDVVGFTPPSSTRDPKITPGNLPRVSARFGWIIGPERDGPAASERRLSMQQAQLGALVAVPSWWRSVLLRTCSRSLIERQLPEIVYNKKTLFRPNTECRIDIVRLPGTGQDVSTRLGVEVVKFPFVRKIPDKNLVVLETGKSGDLLLEGGRLWRSTAVMLGAQKADKIEVLPDMQGVIAHFDCVATPSLMISGPGMPDTTATGTSVEGPHNATAGSAPPPPPKSTYVPVRVWTSEGSTTEGVAVEVRTSQRQPCRNELPQDYAPPARTTAPIASNGGIKP